MKRTFKVEGMSCVNCARTIEIALKKKEGVKGVEVSFELGRVKVSFDERKISEEEIVRTIEDLGYRVVEDIDRRRDLYILLLSALSSLLITLLMFYQVPYGMAFQLLLSTFVQIVGGWKFYVGAYNSLRNGVAGMDVLVALGTSGAYLYSLFSFLGILGGYPFFETNAFLITFVRGGRFIEEKAKERATSLLKRLLSVQNSEVTVFENGREIRKNVREIFKGEVFLCRTGDMIPLDGVIVEGEGYVSEAVLTGEPEAKPKKVGDRVISGSIVEEGYLKIRAEATYESSYLSKVSSLVERALSDKPKVQRVADKVSHYFVQFVVAVAVLTFLLWFWKSGDLQRAVQFSLAVLVISCPCALGIATPLAVTVGLSMALKNGILVKKPSILEGIPKLDVLIFDKTGTITEGKFKVIKHELYENGAIDLAYSLEARSNHPIAVAIREFARRSGAKEIPLTDCREIIGKGVLCGDYFIGEETSKNGAKVISLKKGEKTLARFYLRDILRQEAKETVKKVKELGIRTVLLSGDRKENVERMARDLGFDEFVAEVSPEGKREFVEKLQKEGKTVGMVGDGVNDAPALAQADVSFAVPQGVDITKQVGDVVLLSGIGKLPLTLRLGRRVRRKIFQNLGWAFIYNVIGIPVAAGALYSYGIVLKPEIAGLMMALSSLSVVLNTLLLYNSFPKSHGGKGIVQGTHNGSDSSEGYRASPERAGRRGL